jgi:predicted ATPase
VSDRDRNGQPNAVGIRRLQIRNYKSIGAATVELGPLTILVGANGAGKTNFVDALSFVRDCVSDSVELAFKDRGGIASARRRSGGHPTHIGIRLLIDLPDSQRADYAFEIAAERGERFSIARERCFVQDFLGESHSFELKQGVFIREIPGIRAKVGSDRLALFAASATDEFRPLFDFLAGMRFYSIDPVRLQGLQDPDAGDFLEPDGRNAAAVLKRLHDNSRDHYDRICRLLAAAVEGIQTVTHRPVGKFETLEFKQDVGLKSPWTFEAHSVSDGTLRMLGLLLAVFQLGPVSVLTIEEPEASVHPAVTEQIVQVLRDASRDRQILITTHSPDLLDYPDVGDEELRVVTKEGGSTIVAPLAEVSRDAVRRQLYTSGELLRVGELEPDVDRARRMVDQLSLFGPALTA